MDLATNRVVEAELTDANGGETLDRFAVRPGGALIVDAGYAHRGPLGRIAEREAHFIVRFGWSTLPLENEAGETLDLLTTLETLPAVTSSTAAPVTSFDLDILADVTSAPTAGSSDGG